MSIIKFLKKSIQQYVDVSEDNPFPVQANIEIGSVTATDVAIKDGSTAAKLKVNPDGSINSITVLTGSYVRLSSEEKPTAGVKDGDDLLEVDTKKVFIFYAGSWREI